ncbi:UNVERIFIED_CONTAM: hypothetical protein HDU68_009361 [Siphonaria sp. JEL0065]|nr:hypothetical protein HDU68_009361 [Siphonaria sp. JEL0065]
MPQIDPVAAANQYRINVMSDMAKKCDSTYQGAEKALKALESISVQSPEDEQFIKSNRNVITKYSQALATVTAFFLSVPGTLTSIPAVSASTGYAAPPVMRVTDATEITPVIWTSDNNAAALLRNDDKIQKEQHRNIVGQSSPSPVSVKVPAIISVPPQNQGLLDSVIRATQHTSTSNSAIQAASFNAFQEEDEYFDELSMDMGDMRIGIPSNGVASKNSIFSGNMTIQRQHIHAPAKPVIIKPALVAQKPIELVSPRKLPATGSFKPPGIVPSAPSAPASVVSQSESSSSKKFSVKPPAIKNTTS